MQRDDNQLAAGFGQADPVSKADGDEERIGYKRPPRHSQFRKGQSGNLRGRPKGSLNKSTLRALVAAQWLEETIKIVVGGRTRHVPRLSALMMKQGELGLKGDLRAIRDIFDLVVRLAVDESTLQTNDETLAEDEEILRNHCPGALDANEPDRVVSEGDREDGSE